MKLADMFRLGILARASLVAQELQMPLSAPRSPYDVFTREGKPMLIYGTQVRRASRSRYTPHVGNKQAQKGKYLSREERKARALVSMNSKGLPYRYVHASDGSAPPELRAFGQPAGAGWVEA